MRWLVPALCGVAVVVAVAMGAAGRGDAGDDAGDQGRAGAPVSSVATVGGTEDPGAGAVAGLRDAATEAVALSTSNERRLLEDCLTVPEGADPSLSPDPDVVEVVASGEATGAAVVAWVGPTPQYERAVGTCVALDRGEGWTIVGRSVRRDLGPAAPSLAWQPAASADGVGAALVGRVREGASEVLLVLDDGRVLRQEPTGGFVAMPWQPVRNPTRLVTFGADGRVRYAGPLTGYAD